MYIKHKRDRDLLNAKIFESKAICGVFETMDTRKIGKYTIIAQFFQAFLLQSYLFLRSCNCHHSVRASRCVCKSAVYNERLSGPWFRSVYPGPPSVPGAGGRPARCRSVSRASLACSLSPDTQRESLVQFDKCVDHQIGGVHKAGSTSPPRPKVPAQLT